MHEKAHFKILMPPDVRDWLDKAAPRAQRSRGAHIVFLLRQEMEKEKTEEAQPASTPSSVFDRSQPKGHDHE